MSICADCAGGIDSLVELLQGRFAKGVVERICRQGDGLFPKPAEIRFSCSCLDHASMCKHVAAALYGVGARLDAQPELLFRLCDVDENDLVARIDSSIPLAKVGPASGKVLDTDDLSALFGLDIGGGDAAGALALVPSEVRTAIASVVHHSIAAGFGAALAIGAVVALLSSMSSWVLIRAADTPPSRPQKTPASAARLPAPAGAVPAAK